VEPESVGINRSELTRVVEIFKKQQLSGAFAGGQLAVRRSGKLVVNDSLGIARGFRSQELLPPMPVQPQTPFPVLSAGKPLAAICIALLEERGLLDVEVPIPVSFRSLGNMAKIRSPLWMS
jgi:CubicO group peptidase (beta-lactamase class C family)